MDSLIAMLPSWMNCLNTSIDFVGQQKAEIIYEVVIVVSAVVGFIVGFYTQQMSHMVYAIGIGFGISCVICLPAWPCFRRNPISWLANVAPPVLEQDKTKTSEETTEGDKKTN
uniref:Signal peptidase complex subunit 1 n=1 Tax=Rhabditophanes sp. KR3021 TaxID=114890 RepID=A0AC35UDN7_9BILA